MNQTQKIMITLILMAFTVFVGFVVAECGITDMTGREPVSITRTYDVITTAFARVVSQ